MLRWLTENEADTRDPDGPRGRRFPAPRRRVWEALLAEVEARPRWTISAAEPEEGRLEVECRTRVLRFVDDLAVAVREEGAAGESRTRVEARSSSRMGVGDLGVNRRRVRRLMRALDRRLSA